MKCISLSIAAGVACGSFALAQIPKANLWAHYSSVNGVNGKSTALPDKTVVTSWNDISGNNRHLTKVNSSSPAIAKDAGSCGRTAVYFRAGYVYADPGDNGFKTPLAGAKTIFVVGKANTGASRDYFFDGRPATGQLGRTAFFAGQNSCLGDWTAYMGGSGGGTIGCGAKDPIHYDRFIVHTLVLSDGKQEHYVNGKLTASGKLAKVGTLDGLIVGARVNRSFWLDGYITHLAIYKTALAPSLRNVVERILMGLTSLGYAESYGSGCADSGSNTPVFRAIGCAQSPGALAFSLTKGTPSSVGILLFGLKRSNIPFGDRTRNCSILSSPPWFLSIAAATSATGEFQTPALPMPKGLIGFMFTTQVAMLDRKLKDAWAFSNGLEVKLDK